MYSSQGFSDMTRRGFPHSGIHGSTPACGSPWLIAANHALLRLLAPRHPPSALSSLTTNLSRACALCGVEAKVRFSRHSANQYVALIRASSCYSVVNDLLIGRGG